MENRYKKDWLERNGRRIAWLPVPKTDHNLANMPLWLLWTSCGTYDYMARAKTKAEAFERVYDGVKNKLWRECNGI